MQERLTPLLTHWSYIFLALTYRYHVSVRRVQMTWYISQGYLWPYLLFYSLGTYRWSSANALELHLSITNPSIYNFTECIHCIISITTIYMIYIHDIQEAVLPSFHMTGVNGPLAWKIWAHWRGTQCSNNSPFSNMENIMSTTNWLISAPYPNSPRCPTCSTSKLHYKEIKYPPLALFLDKIHHGAACHIGGSTLF